MTISYFTANNILYKGNKILIIETMQHVKDAHALLTLCDYLSCILNSSEPH